MHVNRLIVGEIKTNCYLVIVDAELAIIDPGGDVDIILKKIKKIKAKPKYIINTHYHWDHTFANKEVKTATNAKILIYKDESKKVDFKADRYISDNDQIKISGSKLKVIHTPGHSRGSICLFGNKVVFTGDTFFKNSYGRTDLPTGSDEDMRVSLIKLVDLIKPGMTVYPGHGEPFTYSSGMLDEIIKLLDG